MVYMSPFNKYIKNHILEVETLVNIAKYHM